MKKTTLVAGLVLASMANAQTFSPNPNGITESVNTGYSVVEGGMNVNLTQNSDTSSVDPGSVACSAKGLHADNSYYRRFDLDGLGTVNVESIDVGIETAASGTDGTQPVEIRIYSIANAAALALANIVPVNTLMATQADASAIVQNYVITGEVNGDTDDLVVEYFTPDGQDVGHAFFIGSNAAGQTAPSFIKADDCGLTEIGDLADIGFGDMHIIMVVNGNASLPVELMNFSID